MHRDPPQIESYDQDDDLIAAVRSDRNARWRVYRYGGTAVVLGRGSNPEIELNLAECEADQVRVLRRHGGGCAVVLDPGTLIVSVAMPMTGIGDNRRYLLELCEWTMSGLHQLGVSGLYCDGISDVALDNRKVGGSCLYRSRDLLFFTLSLLCQPDLDLIERYLRHPPREPEYRQRRSHRDFVTSIGLLNYASVDLLATAMGEVLGPLPRLNCGRFGLE